MDSAIVDKLRSISLFEELREDDSAMERLVKICTIREYSRDRAVIKENELGDEMYIVYRGAVEIRKRTRAGDDYTVVRLSAENNVFFGELALVDDDRRSASVFTTMDSEFIVITKKDFTLLGDQHPEVGLPITRAIARILAGRLRKTTGDMLTIFDALVTEIA